MYVLQRHRQTIWESTLVPKGKGRYDEDCNAIFERAGSGTMGVAVIVSHEDLEKCGFSVTATADLLRKMPAMLRALADAVEKDMRETNEDLN